MPEVVELVSPLEVAVPRLLAGSSEHGVEVPVGLLRRSDDLGETVDPIVGVGRPGPADLPRHRLHQLVHVGVGEHHALVVAGDGSVGRACEVPDPLEPFHPALAMGQRRRRVDVLTFGPAPADDLDLIEAEWSKAAAAGDHRACVAGHFTAPVRNPATKYFCRSR